MAGNRKNYIPQSGKCDLFEGILMGGKQINNLNKKNQDVFKPTAMSKKFMMIARESKSLEDKQKSEFVIEALKVFNQDFPLSETDRRKILTEVNLIKFNQKVKA